MKKRNLKNEILKLRASGKTYTEIKKILQCSKGTISFHCGKGQKEKYKNRQQKNRKNKSGIIRGKIYTFFKFKILNFRRRKHHGERNYSYGKVNSRFYYNTAYKKIFDNPICYLTGEKINFENNRSYNLDHITPTSRGGKNTLSNMGLSCRIANVAKGDLTVDEFIKLCIEVCKYNGYKVIKNKTRK